MTIHELEKRTGLPRASIRFYEKEGLLSPKRLANGYRDYSEEEALTLEKIALLRRLDLPLEDIRRVQRGEVPLGLALEKQDEALVARQKETEQALRISRAIRNEGASYSTLQPEKYKAQLPPPRQIVLPREPKHYATKHPWRRLLARELDMALLTLPGIFLLAWLVAGFKVWLWAILLALIVCAAGAALEPNSFEAPFARPTLNTFSWGQPHASCTSSSDNARFQIAICCTLPRNDVLVAAPQGCST